MATHDTQHAWRIAFLLISTLNTIAVYILQPPTWPRIQMSTVLETQPNTSIGMFVFGVSCICLARSLCCPPDMFAFIATVAWLGLLAFPSKNSTSTAHYAFAIICFGAFAAHFLARSQNRSQFIAAIAYCLIMLSWLVVLVALEPPNITQHSYDACSSLIELIALIMIGLWFAAQPPQTTTTTTTVTTVNLPPLIA